MEPATARQRQYEALRTFFVEGLASAEVARRFGYLPAVDTFLATLMMASPGALLAAARRGRSHADHASGLATGC
jgi:hypothetical protein